MTSPGSSASATAASAKYLAGKGEGDSESFCVRQKRPLRSLAWRLRADGERWKPLGISPASTGLPRRSWFLCARCEKKSATVVTSGVPLPQFVVVRVTQSARCHVGCVCCVCGMHPVPVCSGQVRKSGSGLQWHGRETEVVRITLLLSEEGSALARM